MRVTRTTRVTSVLTAALLVFVSTPAVAQPSDTPPPSSPPAESSAPSESATPPATDAGAGLAEPPPLPPGTLIPKDSGGPDKTYVLKKNCVQSGGNSVPLQHKPWGQDRLQFDEIEKFASGKGQMVAVIDTGVTPHLYLGDRLVGGGDYVAAENGLKDCDGHGTEVAGIIAANPNNKSIGFRGIAPDARILSIRQSSGNYEFKEEGSQEPPKAAGDLGTLAQAIVRAADTPGVTVINMSVNSCRPASAGSIKDPEVAVQSALRYAVEDKNIVVVASAGNLPEGVCTEQNSPDPKNPTQIVIPPWFADYVLSVAAVTKNGDVAEFSMNGPWVSVAAPGTDIISLDPVKSDSLANQTVDEEGKAQPIQGTSFAAPYVAGLAALVRERFPELNAYQVMNRIKQTASHPAATGGHDNLVGYGMINPVAALTAFIPAEKNIPADEPIESPFEMPPPYQRDWTPMQVAMIGSGGGVGLLLLTLFVVHTVRRNRKDEEKPRPRT